MLTTKELLYLRIIVTLKTRNQNQWPCKFLSVWKVVAPLNLAIFENNDQEFFKELGVIPYFTSNMDFWTYSWTCGKSIWNFTLHVISGQPSAKIVHKITNFLTFTDIYMLKIGFKKCCTSNFAPCGWISFVYWNSQRDTAQIWWALGFFISGFSHLNQP